MKRILALVLVLCLILSFCSCAKEQNVNEADQSSNQINEQDSESFVVYYPEIPGIYIYRSTDFFTAKVLDSKQLSKDTVFPGFSFYIAENSNPVLYTVQVKSAIRGFSVTENEKIYVVRYERNEKEHPDNFTSPLEKDKIYVFCGNVDLLKGKPVIVENGSFTVELKDDGSLLPMSLKAKNLFKDCKNFDVLLQDEYVQTVLKTKTISMPGIFYSLLDTDPATIHLKSEQEQQEYNDKEKDIYGIVLTEKEEIRKQLREAIPIDSKKTIIIPKEESEKQDS